MDKKTIEILEKDIKDMEETLAEDIRVADKAFLYIKKDCMELDIMKSKLKELKGF